jgi:hypothetical protein
LSLGLCTAALSFSCSFTILFSTLPSIASTVVRPGLAPFPWRKTGRHETNCKHDVTVLQTLSCGKYIYICRTL